MTRICPDCGAENADVAQFCKGCGKQLEASPAEVKAESKNSSFIDDLKEKWDTWSTGKKVGILGGGGIALCCIALIVIFLIIAIFVPDESTELSETYEFEGFTLDLPANCDITNSTTTEEEGYKVNTYFITWENSTDMIVVDVMKGYKLVSSEDEYVANMMNMYPGAKKTGTYGDWTVIDSTNVKDNGETVDRGYVLVHHAGDNMIAVSGDNLELIKNVTDTYKQL